MSRPSYASVVLVEPSLSHLDRAFTYEIPGALAVERGSLVRVPFRGRNRRGVVVATMQQPDVGTALPVKAVLGAGLGEEVLDLALWTGARYLATPGEALAAALPPRVASEEDATPTPRGRPATPDLGDLDAYAGGDALRAAVEAPAGQTVVWRPRGGGERADVIARLAAAAAARGRGVLVLLPEVRAAGETAVALEAALGARIAWLGSDRPARERYRGWVSLRAGASRVAVGGRGAVFAPIDDLGLILVDDEAHASYKEGRAPRFHARTVAAERARRSGAALVLVGVPPSIEARAAAQRRTIPLVAPDRGEERRARPPVTVVEAAGERLSPKGRTLSLAAAALGSGTRVVVLVHRSGEELERVAERTFRVLKARRTARVDAEAGAGALRAARAAEVVVATPFIAKDLALGPVGLLAIVDADAALSQPEFRAAEEAFATWWRAARWAAGGRLAIETADPAQAAVAALVRWDPDVLWRAEAARRRELRYPPFASLARIDVPAERADEAAAALRSTEIEVLGPVERDGRTVVVARATRRDELLAALGPVTAAWRAAGEPMRVDVDPWEVFVPKWRS